MRRCCSLLLSAAIFLCLLPVPGAAQDIYIASEAAILMDKDTGQVLCGKNMDERMYPASITKVMTALVALKHSEPEDPVIVGWDIFDQVPRTSSHIALMPGERITMRDALYALAIVSANDAAVAIAQAVSGSVEEFCDLMNEEAAALGAHNTHFSNSNGLPAQDHYTTARDMALITAQALEQPEFLTYFGALEYTIPATNLSEPRELLSKNQFIDGTVPCDGLLMSKTGWTSQALGTLVTAARLGNTTLIAVTMKCLILEDKYSDTAALLNYGFSAFRRLKLSERLMKKKMTQQGMGENFVLEDYRVPEVLVPISAGEADISVTVPGGFDAELGLSAVPVNIDARQEDGSWIHVAELLLSVRELPQKEQEVEALAELPEEAPPQAATVSHPGVYLILTVAAITAALWVLGKRKNKSA